MIVKGQKINDRYEVIRLIGEGGMANVYLAQDTILDRLVAVKVLRGDLAEDEKFVRRFQREANSASKIIHPNIVEIYDVGEDQGEYYIVMEYIDGRDLKSLIKKRKGLTLSETVDIMLQLTSAVACAHDSYIIHRDIKPQNILIMDDGKVKITDFGIAQAMNSQEMTQTNSVMGSVHYIAPEQANGSGATAKSDIYSLGILMYELIIGKVPFKGENAVEIALKQMKEPIPSVIEQKEDIPMSIENIIKRATAKNPKNRYESVQEMHDDIKTCLDRARKDEDEIVFEYPEHENKTNERASRLEKNSLKNEEIIEEEKSKKSLWITLGILGVLILAGLSFFLFKILTKKPDIKIADVSNMTVEKAKQKLKKQGFKVKEKEEYSDTVEEDKVIKTSPKAGRSVKKGTSITIYVSKGPEGFEIEDYVGQNYLTVKTTLESNGIIVEKVEEEHTNDDGTIENTILKQDVEKGTKLKSGDTITFTVPSFITIYPDFVNEVYTVSDVEEFCKKNNVDLTVKEKEDANQKEGTIVYQSVAAGKKVTNGGKLTITVTKKPVVQEQPNNQTPTEGSGENGTTGTSGNGTGENKTQTSNTGPATQ